MYNERQQHIVTTELTEYQDEKQMKKIGILGGLGPESTVDYYKEIISAFNSKYTSMAYPDILVYSANINELMTFVGNDDWQGLSKWLLGKIDSLKQAGANFVAIALSLIHI